MVQSIVTSLLYFLGERNLYPIEINGEIKRNKSLTSGEVKTHSLNFFEEDTHPRFREDALNHLRHSKLNSTTISIDYRLLKDKEILEILREKQILVIRIIGDNYKLTEEDFTNLSFAGIIIVDDCVDALKNNELGTQIILQKNKYKTTYDNEVYNGQVELVINYFITDENMSFDDIKELVNNINNSSDFSKKLNIRFYNPEKYIHFLTKLKMFGLDSNVTITLLGYPLKDKSTKFSILDYAIDNKINIIYDTCKDMLFSYMNEPFHGNSLYQSELEGGGVSTLKDYVKILKVLENIENHIKFNNYSPLESAIYCQNYLKTNYIYDPKKDETDNIDYDTNRKLHSVVNRDTMVCAGYATLYSAMLRRIGIPVFRFTCDRHEQNIMIIKDDKYGVDCITTCDVTNDTVNKGILETYIYFMLSPKELIKSDKPSFITIPISLIMKESDYDNYYTISYSPYEINFNLMYSPIGYTHTMLKLMGFEFEDTKEGLYGKLEELNNQGYFDKINPEIIKKAFVKVTTQEQPHFKAIEDNLKEYFDECIKIRNDIFINDNCILINYPETGEPYVVQIDLMDKNKSL